MDLNTAMYVYPLSLRGIKKKIDGVFDEYTYLLKVANEKKKIRYWEHHSKFLKNQSSLCDIIAEAASRLQQEKQQCVKLSEKKIKYHENQKLHQLEDVRHLLTDDGN